MPEAEERAPMVQWHPEGPQTDGGAGAEAVWAAESEPCALSLGWWGPGERGLCAHRHHVEGTLAVQLGREEAESRCRASAEGEEALEARGGTANEMGRPSWSC